MKFMNMGKFGNRYMAEAGDDGAADGSVDAGAAELVALQSRLAELESSNEKLSANSKKLLDEKISAKKAADAATFEATKKSGDMEAIEKSYTDKYNNDTNELKSTIDSLNGIINKKTVGHEATALAARISIPDSAEAVAMYIRSRMDVEMRDGEAVLRIMDKDGRPTALTVDDLEKEIRTLTAWKPLLVGSKASGSGEPGSKGSGGNVVTRAEYENMTSNERMTWSLKPGASISD